MSGVSWHVTVPLFDEPCVPTTRAEELDGYLASLVTFPQVYVLVAWPVSGFFDEVPADVERRLDVVRAALAVRAGIAVSPTIPKVGLVARGIDVGADAWFRTRIAEGGGWHPGAPGSGLLALGAAALVPGTVVHRTLPDPTATSWRVLTPAGLRGVALQACPDGRLGLRVAVVVVIEEVEL